MLFAHPPLTAVIDACVLHNAAIRDTLLLTVDRDLYQPVWTDRIWDEALRSLTARKSNPMSPDKARTLFATIQRNFPDGFVTGYEALIPIMTNHEKDRHVLAAAVRAQARVIVTFNIADFPEEALAPYHIEAQHPDVFLTALYDIDPATMVGVIREQAQGLKNPPTTVERLLARLERDVPGFVALIRQHIRGEQG